MPHPHPPPIFPYATPSCIRRQSKKKKDKEKRNSNKKTKNEKRKKLESFFSALNLKLKLLWFP